MKECQIFIAKIEELEIIITSILHNESRKIPLDTTFKRSLKEQVSNYLNDKLNYSIEYVYDIYFISNNTETFEEREFIISNNNGKIQERIETQGDMSKYPTVGIYSAMIYNFNRIPELDFEIEPNKIIEVHKMCSPVSLFRFGYWFYFKPDKIEFNAIDEVSFVPMDTKFGDGFTYKSLYKVDYGSRNVQQYENRDKLFVNFYYNALDSYYTNIAITLNELIKDKCWLLLSKKDKIKVNIIDIENWVLLESNVVIDYDGLVFPMETYNKYNTIYTRFVFSKMREY